MSLTMRKPALLVTIFILSSIGLSCSKSRSGTYVHDYGPRREFIELKPDKTLSIYEQMYKDGKRERGKFTETGTYSIDGDTLKTHTTVTITYGDKTTETKVHDYEWHISENVLIKKPEAYRYRLEPATGPATAQNAKLIPELTETKAQEAIDKWAEPWIRNHDKGKVIAEVRGPLVILPPPEKSDDPTVRVFNLKRVRVHSLKEESDGHIATAVLQFTKFPTPASLRPQPSSSQTYVPFNPYNPTTTVGTSGIALMTCLGDAVFFHDSNGKWTLIGLEAKCPENYSIDLTRHWNMRQLNVPDIEIK